MSIVAKRLKEIDFLAAIIAITIIECVAITNGIDGRVLILSIAAISGLGGYSLKDILTRINKK